MPEKTYGPVAKDRGGQITFSANGQQASIEVKSLWDPTEKKRLAIASYLFPLCLNFQLALEA